MNAPVRVQPRQWPEFRLQVDVATHLRLGARPGVYFTAIPLGELRDKRTAAKVKAMGAVAGAPDLLLIVGGRAHGLELKAGRNKQSEAQKTTQAAWEAAGGVYEVATGIDEALAVLTKWEVL